MVSAVALWQNPAPIVKRAHPPRPDHPAGPPVCRRAARLAIDAAGCTSGAMQVASPNCDNRPDDTPISLIVVHGISLPPGQFGGNAIERLFTNRLDPAAHPAFAAIATVRVSAHYLVRRDGTLVQFVPCMLRAWHAGESAWRGRVRCNDFSIGVEIEGADDIAYEPMQYTTLGRLTRALRRRYPIVDIVGHSDIAPGRKTDPGSAFDWMRLACDLGLRLPGRIGERRTPGSRRTTGP
jgi:N-acetyl-anhydromuramoyl-L-alanine amidase